MCGIVAILRQGGQVSVEALNRAVGALEHRGPDGQQHWVDPHGRVALGHARLSIIDLATGDQPIANEDRAHPHRRERRVLRLRASTGGARGARRTSLRTRSDSEIALHLYEDLRRRMRASVCAANTRSRSGTTRNQQLFAGRDRFGVKPLFYAEHDGALYLASEVKALFAMGVPARWDPESVLDADSCRRASAHFSTACTLCRPGHFLSPTRRRASASISTGTSTIPRDDAPSAARTRRRVHRRISGRARGGRAASPPRRRAGRLLPERRHRLVRGARSRGAASRGPVRAFTLTLRRRASTTKA